MNGAARILLVEDDEDDFIIFQDLVKGLDTPHEVSWRPNYEEGLATLRECEHDICFVDYRLGASTGLDLLEVARGEHIDVPIVLLTGQGDLEIDRQAMKAGAADYLVKGTFDEHLLERTIRYTLERRQSLKALRESEERYALAVSAASDVVWDWDLVHNDVYISKRYQTLLGFDDDEVGNKPEGFWKHVHPEDQDNVRLVVEAHQRGTSDHFEVTHRMVAKSGETKWVINRGMAVRDADGVATRMAGTLSDITEQKEAESALKESEAKFRQAQKLEAIGKLAGGVAHDFNNMLTVVIAYCDLLVQNVKQDKHLLPDIEEIRSAGNRASSLTRQLLAFSRKQVLMPREFDVNGLIEEMEKMFSVILSANIGLDLRLDSEPHTIKSDPGQMEQVLMNLVVNARDAIEANGQVTVSTRTIDLQDPGDFPDPEMGAGKYVVISVSDNGCGMDKETMARIFEPFFTTKEEGKGTGLGLATVYGIVKQSGGVLDVTSTPGVGTTFDVYMPKVHTLRTRTQDANVIDDSLGGSETVLLVEDDDGVRNAARMSLARRGYNVIAAPTGMEGLKKFKEAKHIDLLILDLVMPDIDGSDLAEEIYQVKGPVKTIFMTGYAEKALELEEDYSKGAFIHKPFSSDQLMKLMRKLLDKEMPPEWNPVG